MTVMREEEVRIACEVAHDFGRRVASHSRASNAVKRAVQCGVDVIYHCEMADSEALDLLEAARERIFVGPAIGLIHNTLYEAEAFGITRAMAQDLGMERCLESSQRTYEQMRKRGIRVVSAATTASPGRRRAPTRATSSTSSSCSATRRARRCSAPRASAAS